MAKLRVTLIDEVRKRRLKVDLPDDAAMEKLLPALAEKLGLPVTDPGAQPIAYRLTHQASGRALGGDQTLASFGVREGDALRLAAAREEAPAVLRPAVELVDFAEAEAVSLWQKVPVWGWVGIVVVVLLAVAVLAFLADRGAKPVLTPTVAAEVTTPATTSTAMPRPTATPAPRTDTPVPPTSTPVPPTATPVPTSTPRPTATPVPPTDTPVPPTPTPVPTSTPTPLPLTYDENFNDPAFDGTYNTVLWSREEGAKGSTSTVEQRDGVLVVSQTSGLWGSNAGLSTKKHSNWLLSDLGYVEAKLMLDGNFDGEFVGNYVQVNSNDTDWLFTCFIAMCKAGQFCTHPWDRPVMNCATGPDQAMAAISVEYNTWHTARIEVDPGTVTFHLYFDGYYFDSFTPPNAAALKDDSFRVEVGLHLEPKSSATGYIDDVRIGK
jgi:hypothetical protein